MAITATLGATINNATPGTTLIFASNVMTVGQVIVFAVAILNTLSPPSYVTVSGITDTTNPATFRSAVNNASGVRVELWTTTITTSSSARVFIITLSGASLASAAYEEYATTGLGNMGTTASGSTIYAEADVATQDTGSWGVTAFAVATNSGDTFTANLGTIRQHLIPALTTAGVALVDNTSTVATPELRNLIYVSTARAWGAAAMELRTGVAATLEEPANVILTTSSNTYLKHQLVSAGTGATLPPAGSANSGYVG